MKEKRNTWKIVAIVLIVVTGILLSSIISLVTMGIFISSTSPSVYMTDAYNGNIETIALSENENGEFYIDDSTAIDITEDLIVDNSEIVEDLKSQGFKQITAEELSKENVTILKYDRDILVLLN